MLHRRELWVDLARPLIRHLAHAAIPKAIQFLVLALAALLCFLAAGCTSAHHERVAYFAEYGEDGRTNYYRVKVSWTAENGIVDYRSGWFDARAVDELFGEVSGKHDLEAARKNRAQVAVARTFDAYMTALEQGDSVDAIAVRRAAYEEALERALTVVQVVPITEAGQVLNPLDDKKSKKFLIIFSQDPDAIIQGIRARIKSSTVSDTLGDILEQQTREKTAPMLTRLHLLKNDANALERRLGGAEVTDAPSLAALISELEEGK